MPSGNVESNDSSIIQNASHDNFAMTNNLQEMLLGNLFDLQQIPPYQTQVPFDNGALVGDTLDDWPF